MNVHGPVQTILLILGIIILVKSIWGLAHPVSVKKLGNWWARAALHVNTLCGVFYIIVAVGFWMAVLLDQSWNNRLLAAFGVLFAWFGTIYLKPQEMQKFIRKAITNRSLTAIRVISLISAVIALVIIGVAYKGL